MWGYLSTTATCTIIAVPSKSNHGRCHARLRPLESRFSFSFLDPQLKFPPLFSVLPDSEKQANSFHNFATLWESFMNGELCSMQRKRKIKTGIPTQLCTAHSQLKEQ